MSPEHTTEAQTTGESVAAPSKQLNVANTLFPQVLPHQALQ